jgi:hypothetical protein
MYVYVFYYSVLPSVGRGQNPLKPPTTGGCSVTTTFLSADHWAGLCYNNGDRNKGYRNGKDFHLKKGLQPFFKKEANV